MIEWNVDRNKERNKEKETKKQLKEERKNGRKNARNWQSIKNEVQKKYAKYGDVEGESASDNRREGIETDRNGMECRGK